MNHADESYDEVNDDELYEIFDVDSPDVDLIKLENEILTQECYSIYVGDVNENYVLLND